MLEVGDKAPEFSLPDQSGKTVTATWPWPDETVKAIVLFFYPKADTPGCTVEACGFRDAKADFDSADVVLLGLSPDTAQDQAAFATKYGLPMQLLADADHAVAVSYGVWGEKNNYGKKYMGINRTTFIIDREGKISHIFHKVKVDGHSDAVLKAVQES